MARYGTNMDALTREKGKKKGQSRRLPRMSVYHLEGLGEQIRLNLLQVPFLMFAHILAIIAR